MFGFIIPNYNTLKENEKNRYQSIYCGLCHSLRENYSNISRLALNYDLTFLALLLSSLYEPAEEKENCKCIFHPGKKFQIAKNQFSDYCADLTVALAYHKILDDIKDDGTLKAKIGEKALRDQYKKVTKKLPEATASIEKFMDEISEMESDPTGPESGDEIAKYFGMLLGSLFTPKDDNWKETLIKFSANLGRFVYFMDAAVDYENDIKENNYNPFKMILKTDTVSKEMATEMKNNLSVLAGEALQYFEKLPLEQDLKLLQNILYEGMWIQFNQKYYKDKK